MLEVRNLNLFYGASQALYRVSLEARPGEVCCLLGRNGVGKTSMLQSVAGHLPIQSGEVIWQGEDVTAQAPYERARKGIAYVPQGREIFSQLTVLENLKTAFAALPHKDRHIPDSIFDLFPVLRKMLKRRGGDLSGGQQQQLAIARALVTRPRLLMLDEPTEGIQPSIIKDIQRVIMTLKAQGDMAILLVEQYFEFAEQLGDHFVVMDRGHVVLAGDRGEVSADEVRERMLV